MKRIVIVGATSGIGLEVAKLCIQAGWQIGAAGRREEALEKLRTQAPDLIVTESLDITRDDAPEHLSRLIDKLGGMDIYLHCSGNATPSCIPTSRSTPCAPTAKDSCAW